MGVKLCIIKLICYMVDVMRYMVLKTYYMVEKIYHMTKKDFCLSYDKHMGDPRPQCTVVTYYGQRLSFYI